MNKNKIVIFNILIIFLLSLLGTSVVGAHSLGSDVSKQLADVRQATAKYHNIDVAFNDGYVTDYHCVPNMGIHLVNPDLLFNGFHDPLKPEVLVYEPKKNGGYKLVAAEYLAPGGERPTLFGQEFDDGPFPGSYALHAWVWEQNPNGMFSPYNPKVTGCN
ncbi:hypothetical protein [Salipaludibacillus daqingensis]|uniref:hypothetical protein n=1 Tax=Salipaludibacillus daqingensis TaxID=3041001 RepID=UPI0024770308|nr:hypothetical protein [Salipaludibacillus daqingensis]